MKTNKLIEKTKGLYKRSFTLIELIVVIVVIGILAAIVVPNISSFKDDAKETAMLSDGKNLQTAVDMYQLDNHGDLPVLVEEGAESKNPTLGEPKAIDFDALYPEYIRDLPQHVGMYYWIDYQGQVYLSMIDNPDDFNQDANGLSWTANDQAVGYEVYEVESSNTSASKRAVLKSVGKLKGQIDSLSPVGYTSEKTYLISVVDSYGNIAAPVKNTYSGVAPYGPQSNQPLTPEQEALVQDPRNIMVATGNYHTLVVDKDGSLWSFGINNYGQLGHTTNSGGNTPNLTPKKIMTNVKSVTAGGNHSLVIKDNGDLYSFGHNIFGQLGHATNVSLNNANPTPTLIMTNVKSVAAHDYHSLVIKENGDLFSFGFNHYGQLGHATNNNTNNPNPSHRLIMTNVKSVAAGFYHTLVVKENGDLFSFGYNIFGQLGHATNNRSQNPNPTQTLIMTNVKSAEAGMHHSLVVKENGNLISFGYNYYGELGYAANNLYHNPNPSHTTIMTDVKSVASHGHHTLAIKENGELFSFGRNNYGQLGHTTNNNTNNPTPSRKLIMIGVNVKSVTTGLYHTLVTKENGELVSFGHNRYGQLGHTTNSGTDTSNPTPTQIYLPTE